MPPTGLVWGHLHHARHNLVSFCGHCVLIFFLSLIMVRDQGQGSDATSRGPPAPLPMERH